MARDGGTAATGWLAVDMLGWIIGGAIIAAGIALLLAGWAKTGWSLIAFGTLIGLVGP